LARPAVEVADIFRAHGPAWRRAQAGHLSLGQLKVMSAIERCRTVALGGHVARCEKCDHIQIAYNSLYGDLFVKLSASSFLNP
jgi:Transposase zinc-binding domain